MINFFINCSVNLNIYKVIHEGKSVVWIRYLFRKWWLVKREIYSLVNFENVPKVYECHRLRFSVAYIGDLETRHHLYSYFRHYPFFIRGKQKNREIFRMLWCLYLCYFDILLWYNRPEDDVTSYHRSVMCRYVSISYVEDCWSLSCIWYSTHNVNKLHSKLESVKVFEIQWIFAEYQRLKFRVWCFWGCIFYVTCSAPCSTFPLQGSPIFYRLS